MPGHDAKPEAYGEILEANARYAAAFDGTAWSNPHRGGGSSAGRDIAWLTISDQSHAVTHDVRRIREHPLVPGHIPIFGFVYDVATGRLNEIEAASAAGRPIAPAPLG